MKRVFIFGAGPSGAVVARRYAEEGYGVLVFETKNHIGGNIYDYKNEKGIIVHKYGPHIFQCSNEVIINYVKSFSEWKEFRHKVNVMIKDKEVPLPINFTSIDILFPKKAKLLKEKLIKAFNSEIAYVMDLLNNKDKDIHELGKFVYDNVFKNYTIKMWGIKPKDIDQSVLKRVPVRLGYDDGYFTDTFQAVPKNGYTNFMKNILNHGNIKVYLNTPKNILQIKEGKTFINNKLIKDKIIWTGAIDQLFNYSEGELPYRSLRFELETINMDRYQKRAVVNYPSHLTMTRITEYKDLSQQLDDISLIDITTIGKEYPGEYKRNSKEFPDPYYPVIMKDGINPAEIYFSKAKKISNLKIIGRLAEYKYKQMWQAIKDALEMEL